MFERGYNGHISSLVGGGVLYSKGNWNFRKTGSLMLSKNDSFLLFSSNHW